MVTGSKICKAAVLKALEDEKKRNLKRKEPNTTLDFTLSNIIKHMKSGGGIEIKTTPKKIRLD